MNSPPARAKSKIGFPEMLVLVIGATRGFAIDFGSSLIVGEVLAVIAAFCYINTSRRILSNRIFLTLGAAWILWIFAQMISDIINSTQLVKMIRLQVAILTVFPALVGVVALLTKRPTVVFWLCAGVGLSAILTMVLPSPLSPIVRWKWGAAGAASLAIAGLGSFMMAGRHPRPLLGGTMLLAAGVTGFFTDARSLSGLIALLGLLVLGKTLLNIFPRYSIARPIAVIGAVLALVFAPPAIYIGYSVAADQGKLGELAATRYHAQSYGGTNPLILARFEVVGSLMAIRDKPIWGHGAWAEDIRYINAVALLLRQIGYEDPTSRLQVLGQTGGALYIPIHSMLFGAWVWGGILSAGFFLVVIWQAGRSAIRAVMGPAWTVPLMGFASFQVTWAVLFSPFSSTNRIDLEIMLGLCLWWLMRTWTVRSDALLHTRMGRHASKRTDRSTGPMGA